LLSLRRELLKIIGHQADISDICLIFLSKPNASISIALLDADMIVVEGQTKKILTDTKLLGAHGLEKP
jgi:hypothetical protein